MVRNIGATVAGLIRAINVVQPISDFVAELVHNIYVAEFQSVLIARNIHAVIARLVRIVIVTGVKCVFVARTISASVAELS